MLLDVLQQEKLEFLFRHWLAIEVALPLIAAAAAQHVLLLARLNALADDGHPRRVALLLEPGVLDTHPQCLVRR